MKTGAARYSQFFWAAAFVLAMVGVQYAQQIPSGHATDFKSNTYFESPNERKIKMTLTGAAAEPLAGGLLDIKQLEIRTFSLDGKTEFVLRAPQCTYATFTGDASSAGAVNIATGDGRVVIAGQGFLWQQEDEVFIISNRVQATYIMRNTKGSPHEK